MDYLALAKNSLESIDWNEGGFKEATYNVQFAQALAAIAQAEAIQEQAKQLKHIAGMMEGYCALYLDSAILTTIEARKQREISPDPQDYRSESAYLEALDKYNDWRAQMEYGKDTDDEARTDYA